MIKEKEMKNNFMCFHSIVAQHTTTKNSSRIRSRCTVKIFVTESWENCIDWYPGFCKSPRAQQRNSKIQNLSFHAKIVFLHSNNFIVETSWQESEIQIGNNLKTTLFAFREIPFLEFLAIENFWCNICEQIENIISWHMHHQKSV